MHKCLGADCYKIITSRFALCCECEQVYGRRADEWPEWLRFLWKDIQREWRSERRAYLRERAIITYE